MISSGTRRIWQLKLFQHRISTQWKQDGGVGYSAVVVQVRAGDIDACMTATAESCLCH